MSRQNKELKCILCDENNKNETLISVGPKGFNSLQSAAISRGENDKLFQHHKENTLVHESCRKNYVNKKRIRQFVSNKENITPTPVHEKRKNRSASDQCLFCQQELFNDTKHCTRSIRHVTTDTFKNNVIEVCRKRNDEWGLEVFSKISSIMDCVLSNVGYHKDCFSNFNILRSVPFKSLTNVAKKMKIAQHTNSADYSRLLGFKETVKYLQSVDNLEPVTMQEICDKMKSLGYEPYSVLYTKEKLIELFGDTINIISSPNKLDRVAFNSSSIASILDKYYKEQLKNKDISERNTEAEKILILETAATILRSDIEKIEVDKKIYDVFENISSSKESLSYLPISLQIFLSKLFLSKGSEKLIFSLGQALMQATFPRNIIAPLQVFRFFLYLEIFSFKY